jgi:hypothetical protein
MGKRNSNTSNFGSTELDVIVKARKFNKSRRFYVNPSDLKIMDKGEVFCEIKDCQDKETFIEAMSEALNAVYEGEIDLKTSMDIIIENEIHSYELEDLINLKEKVGDIKRELENLEILSDNLFTDYKDPVIEHDEDSDINDLIFSISKQRDKLKNSISKLTEIFNNLTIS